jgi:hypothetical protein
MMQNYEHLDEGDRMRLLKILQEVENLGHIKLSRKSGIKPTVSTLRTRVKMKTAKFWALYKYAKKEALIAEGGKILGEGRRPGIKPILTEKGREFLEKYALPDPTANELILERYGGLKRIRIKLDECVEAWSVGWSGGLGRWPFKLIFDDSQKIDLEPPCKREDSGIFELESEMWSTIVHLASPEEGWSRYPGVEEQMSFKLPDELGLSRSMAKLKEDYNEFWKSPTISGENKIDEKWIPGFLKDLSPGRIEEFKKQLKTPKGASRGEIEELRKKLRKHEWILYLLKHDPNIFMPSPLWRKLGFEVPCIWPAEVSLPFNVNIVGWKVFEIFAKIAIYLPRNDKELMRFTYPFDLDNEIVLMGSPSCFINVLKEHQDDPAFFSAWKHWKRKFCQGAAKILSPVEAAYKRFIFNGVYTDIAQAYIDVWKKIAGKRIREGEIGSNLEKAALAIRKGKYDLAYQRNSL